MSGMVCLWSEGFPSFLCATVWCFTVLREFFNALIRLFACVRRVVKLFLTSLEATDATARVTFLNEMEHRSLRL